MRIKHNLVNLAEMLSEVECKYPVETWTAQRIQFWPILKNIAYFDERRWRPTFKSIFSIFSDRKSFQSAIPKVLNRLGWNKSTSTNDIRSVPKAKVLFSGKDTYRVLFKEKYWNRYFDPIMNEIEDGMPPFMVDYSNDRLEPLYKDYRLSTLNSFGKDRKSSSEVPNDLFYQCDGFKEALAHIMPFFNGHEAQLLEKLKKKITAIIEFRATWDRIIEQVEPDVVFCLCYYNEPMYGLLLAAKERGIPTIDMQHGGQGVLHPAYHFSCSEHKSYNTLPDFFWVWESSAARRINNCFKTTHHAVVGGNPWINYLMKQQHIYRELEGLNKRKIIVCTLTWGLESILPDFLLSAILQSPAEYEWWLRFHPNTPHPERKELVKIIQDNRIEDKIEVIKANEWPLPVLLKIAWAHVSHSSGSLFEASIVGLGRNIVTSETGANNFRDLIQESKVFYYDPLTNQESLIDFAENLDCSNNDTENDEGGNYAEIIRDIIGQFKTNT